MNLDDRSLEELSGLFLEEEAARHEEDLAALAVERGLVAPGGIERPLAAALLRLGKVTAAGLADLVREAERRRVDRLTGELKAGRAADLSGFRRFGRYVFLKELGRGGLGRVWLAWDPELRRLVALKVLAVMGEEHLKRLRREAQVAAQLEHPRIARVYEQGEAHGVHFITMQYVEGGSLEGATLAPLDAARAIRDAARVVEFAHARGIIHRDLKPGNLVRQGEEIWVVDFGLAKPLGWEESASPTGGVLGTLPYMSPEQVEGQAVGPAADVYALGATLYRLATGRAPVQAASVAELVAALSRRDLPSPRRLNRAISPELEGVILKAMDAQACRYPTARELADDLDRVLHGEPPVARAPGAGRRLVRAARRHAAAVLVAVLALAVLAWISVSSASRTSRIRALLSAADGKMAQGRFEEARRDLDEAIRLGGGRPEFLERRARCEERLLEADRVRMDRAGRELEGARALLEEARLNLYKKGATFSARFFSDLDRAVAAAREGAELHETPTARALLGAILHLLGDMEEALAEYSRALELEPTHVKARLGKARAYLDLGVEALFAGREEDSTWHLESARRVFEELPDLAHRLLEGEIESELAWGWSLIAGDRAAEAVAYAGERTGKSEEFWVIQGVAEARSGNPRAAVRSFSAAIDRRPNYYQAFFFRGTAVGEVGSLDYALREYDQALEIHPRYVPCLLARASARHEKGDAAGAAADWEAALRLRPELEGELRPKIAAARAGR